MSAARLRYLEHLGVDVWVRRALPPKIARPIEAAPAGPKAEQASPVSPSEVTPDWAELERQVVACRACRLCETRTRTVFGVGRRDSRLMVVGEAPGADEDRQGEPFVGRAGQLLDAMLFAMGWPREQVFIANLLKCRPPNNRDPQPDELAACGGFLQRQLEWIRPDLILAVGRIAAQGLLQTGLPMARLRGHLHRLPGADTPVVVTYHPAYLLRSPREKARAWEDLKLACAQLGGACPRAQKQDKEGRIT